VRREEILRAAATVVSRTGFARTRAADVAAELGVSTALVFYHFDTKERLLSEAFGFAAREDLERLHRAVRSRGTCTQRLKAVLRLYAPAGDAPGWTLDIDAWAEALRTPEIRTASCEVDRQWREAIETVVRDGVGAGEFTCPDPAASALRIAAMLDGLAVATQVRLSVRRSQAALWAAESAAHELGLPPDALLLRAHRPRRDQVRPASAPGRPGP
jgi:AcrR family transcriptional regulator